MNASEFLYQPSPALPPTSAAGYGAPAAAGGGGGGGGQGGSLQVPGAYPAYAAPAASQGQMGSQQPAAPGMNGINGQVYGAAGAYPTPVSSPASPPAYPQVPPTRQPYANQYLDSGIPLGPVGAAADDDLDDDSDVSSVESLQAPEGGQNLFSATISKMESTFSQTMKARVGKNTKGRALAILASFCLDFAALVFIVSATSGIATWNLTLTWTAYTAATYNGVPGVDVYTGIWGQCTFPKLPGSGITDACVLWFSNPWGFQLFGKPWMFSMPILTMFAMFFLTIVPVAAFFCTNGRKSFYFVAGANMVANATWMAAFAMMIVMITRIPASLTPYQAWTFGVGFYFACLATAFMVASLGIKIAALIKFHRTKEEMMMSMRKKEKDALIAAAHTMPAVMVDGKALTQEQAAQYARKQAARSDTGASLSDHLVTGEAAGSWASAPAPGAAPAPAPAPAAAPAPKPQSYTAATVVTTGAVMGTRSGGNQVQRTASSRSAGAPPPSGSLAPPATAQPSSPTDPSFSPLSVQLSSEAGRLNSSTMDRIRRAQLAQMQQLQAQQAQAQAQMRAQQQHLLASQRAPLSPSAYLAQLPPDARAQVDAQINAQLAQYAGPIAEHVRAQYPQAAPQQQQQAYEYYLGLYREQIEGQYANWIIANAGAGSSSDYGGSMYQGSTTSMYVGSTTSMR